MFEAVQGTRPLELLQSAQAEISERLEATVIQHKSGIDIESSELNFYVLDATTSKTAAAGELASVPYANMIQVPGFIETTQPSRAVVKCQAARRTARPTSMSSTRPAGSEALQLLATATASSRRSLKQKTRERMRPIHPPRKVGREAGVTGLADLALCRRDLRNS